MKNPITIELTKTPSSRQVMGLQETPNGQVEVTLGSDISRQMTMITIPADQRDKVAQFIASK